MITILYVKRATTIALIIFVPIIFALSAATFLGANSYEIDGVALRLSMTPAVSGQSVLSVPPFGEISAKTHESPVRLEASLERVYPEKLDKVAREAPPGDAFIKQLEDDAWLIVRDFVVRLILIGAAAGAIGGTITRKRARNALLGALLGSAVIASLLGGAHSTYRLEAFKQPSYTGVLSTAPWMTDALADRLAALKTFREEIREIASNVHDFYSKVDSWGPITAADGDVRVLHVSDIHTNPAAIDLIERIAKDYRVAFIVDTGDATDFGTPLEASFLSRIAKLKTPYLFVPGNHDSTETISMLKTLPNVTVLDGTRKTVQGIEVLGIGDPSSGKGDELTPDQKVLEYKTRELKRLASLNKPVIAAAHNPRVAGAVYGQVPVVLTGHTHRPDLKQRKGSVMVNAGSTGAAGLRTFREDKGLPYSLQILQFKRGPLRLVAVDTVTVFGLKREFKLERTLVEGASKPGSTVAGEAQ